MSAQDLAIADGLFLLEEFGETVGYQSVEHGITQPWRSIQAVVRRGDAGNPQWIGMRSTRGPYPAVLRISKDPTAGVLEVTPGEDKVKLHPGGEDEMVLTVKSILEVDDPGLWSLHVA